MLDPKESRWSALTALSIVPSVPIEIDRLIWRERLGRALKTARAAAGYTQETAAPELGVDKQTISNWETGRHDMRLFDVVRLATLYEMPAEWIVEPPDSVRTFVEYREMRKAEQKAHGDHSIAQRRLDEATPPDQSNGEVAAAVDTRLPELADEVRARGHIRSVPPADRPARTPRRSSAPAKQAP